MRNSSMRLCWLSLMSCRSSREAALPSASTCPEQNGVAAPYYCEVKLEGSNPGPILDWANKLAKGESDAAISTSPRRVTSSVMYCVYTSPARIAQSRWISAILSQRHGSFHGSCFIRSGKPEKPYATPVWKVRRGSLAGRRKERIEYTCDSCMRRAV